MNLTEEHRRALTELLGERWKTHPYESYLTTGNRTFDNWQDYGLLIEKIKEKGLWEKWIDYAYGNDLGSMDLTEWMLDPARCVEIAEWWTNRKEKE